MAKINAVKVKQDADREEKAGRFDKAITLYRQLVDDNNRDWNTIKKIGDLYARMSKNREATIEYAKVADFYAKDGFLLKSIAIWKQITKLDPAALDPYLNLADLYAKQGLMMEAKSQYQIVVDEYIKRGRTRDAGDVLKRMAEIDPGDLKIRSKLADLYTRDGNAARAVEEHVAIAEELNKKGHLAEALQVLEKGLKIDPKSNRLRLELARVHLVQKNFDRAAHYLEEAMRQSPGDTEILARLGEAYLGAKKMEEAEATFKRLLELDPDDLDHRTQMGRLYLLQGEYDRAYDEFEPVVDRLLERRDGEKGAALLQQLVQRSSSHVPSLVKLVDVYQHLKKDSALAQSYSQLTEAYINQGSWTEAASALEALVSLEPQHEQHRTKLEFVRGKLSSAGRPPAPPARPPVDSFPGPELIDEEFDLSPSEPEIHLEAEPPAPVTTTQPFIGERPRIELSPPLTDEDREFVEEHLAEGRVFRKYGLVDKAADQFESVIARFADDVEARQELKEVFREKGLAAKALEQALALAEIFRLQGNNEQARRSEDEAKQLAAEIPIAAPPASPPSRRKPSIAAPAPAARNVPRPAAAPPPPAAPPPAAPPEIDLAEEEIDLEATEEEIDLEVEESGLDAASVEPEAPELPGFHLEEELSEGELPAQFIDDEPDLPAPSPASELMLEEVPFTASAEEAGSLSEDFALPVEDEPAIPTAEPPPSPVAAEPPPMPRRPAASEAPAAALRPDLQKVLEEVDSYVALGFVDDAKDALREAEQQHPSHPALLRKMKELGLEPAAAALEELEPEPPAAPAAAPSFDAQPAQAVEDPLQELALEVDEPGEEHPPSLEPSSDAASLLSAEGGDLASAGDALPPVDGEGGVDLGAELGELFGTQSAVEEAPLATSSTDFGDSGLADIFKEFKKGVDKQLSKEDYDTRYNLGIAYKEMGLVDEAIAEFQLAAKDEGRMLECSSMLGICFMEKGLPKLAVKWFEKGLKAPGRSDEEYQGLRYDLAMALEAAGDRDKALSLYTDLYGQDATFRDVASKVRELRAALG